MRVLATHVIQPPPFKPVFLNFLSEESVFSVLGVRLGAEDRRCHSGPQQPMLMPLQHQLTPPQQLMPLQPTHELTPLQQQPQQQRDLQEHRELRQEPLNL